MQTKHLMTYNSPRNIVLPPLGPLVGGYIAIIPHLCSMQPYSSEGVCPFHSINTKLMNSPHVSINIFSLIGRLTLILHVDVINRLRLQFQKCKQ